jgi:hypothetical protein
MKNEQLFEIVQSMGKLLTTSSAGAFMMGNIPEKKLNNAILEYALDADPDDVYLLVDTTVFGSAKEGFLLTSQALYIKDMSEKPVSIPLANVLSTEVDAARNGKDADSVLILHGVSWVDVKVTGHTINKSVLKNLIDAICPIVKGGAPQAPADPAIAPVPQTSVYPAAEAAQTPIYQAATPIPQAPADQAAPSGGGGAAVSALIQNLPANVKEAYCAILADYVTQMTFSPNAQASSYPEPVTGFASVLARINADSALKNKVLINSDGVAFSAVSSLQIINPQPTHSLIVLSALKDLMYLQGIYPQNAARSNAAIATFAKYAGVTNEQMNFMLEVIQFDANFVNPDVPVNNLVNEANNLVARCRSLGLPPEFIYLSGSTNGASAASVAAGCAVLGLDSLFGLNGVAENNFPASSGSVSAREYLLKDISQNNLQTVNFFVGTFALL